jgi:DNA-binding Xre family transcriptional regulator
MITYKIDVLESLKEAGYNTTRLRKEKLLNESAIQYLRSGKPVGAKALNNICMLLDMQPGNIIKYVEDDNTIKDVK